MNKSHFTLFFEGIFWVGLALTTIGAGLVWSPLWWLVPGITLSVLGFLGSRK